jgi:cation:H+ antiporter
MGRDFWVMLGVSLLLVAMALGKSRSINRFEGAALFCCFIGYQAYLIMNMTA